MAFTTRFESGDKGQQYEVRCEGTDGGVFGWATTLEGAAAMVQSIQLHPTLHSPVVIDRCATGPGEAVVPLADVLKHAKD